MDSLEVVFSRDAFRAFALEIDPPVLSPQLELVGIFARFPGADSFETRRGIRYSAKIPRPLFSTDRRRIGSGESYRRPIRGIVQVHQVKDGYHSQWHQERE